MICTQPTHSTTSIKLSANDKFIYTYNGSDKYLEKARSCIDYTGITLQEISTNIQITQKDNNLLISNLVLSDKIYQYQITDILGNTTQNGSFEINNGNGNLNIEKLLSGTYFLTINNESYKFMVVR